MNKPDTTSAFTLFEVIISMIILGIVTSIGANIIARAYGSYIMQKSIHNAGFKTDLAIMEMTNRLSYRMDRSVLARKPGNTGLSTDDIYPLQALPAESVNDYTALEWIGYEYDGFSATLKPGWSGFADLDPAVTDFYKLKTTGSDLTKEREILKNIYPGADQKAAIIFLGTSDYRIDESGTLYDYNATCMYRLNGCMFPVILSYNTIAFAPSAARVKGQMKYTEFYQLAASAYAVVPENLHQVDGVDTWDLYFYSDYQPWEGENYTQGKRSLMTRDVSVFRFKKETNSIRVKICTTQAIGEGSHTTICKERSAIK